MSKMKFEEVLPLLRQGKIAKRNKPNSELHIAFSNQRILSKSIQPDKPTKFGFYNLRFEDIEADDWEVVNEV